MLEKLHLCSIHSVATNQACLFKFKSIKIKISVLPLHWSHFKCSGGLRPTLESVVLEGQSERWVENRLEAGVVYDRAGPVRRPFLGKKRWSLAMGHVRGGGREGSDSGQSSKGELVDGLNVDRERPHH